MSVLPPAADMPVNGRFAPEAANQEHPPQIIRRIFLNPREVALVTESADQRDNGSLVVVIKRLASSIRSRERYSWGVSIQQK
jgi:hypothetical protein